MKRRTFFKAVAGAAAGVAVGKLPAAEPKMIPGPVVEFAPKPRFVVCQCALTGRVLTLTQEQYDDAGPFDENGMNAAARWLKQQVAESFDFTRSA